VTAEADRTKESGPRLPGGKPSGVFISYRREDASGFAGRLHESLSGHFGPGRVFRDIDTIDPGADFGEVISTSLRSCGALVVVIGREWLADSSGRRRLDDPTDWVRVELEAALGRDDVLVVPVLVEKAAMPSAADLPASLAPLVRRNALEVSDTRWTHDVKLLTDCLEVAVGPPTVRWPARLGRWMVPKGPLGAVARVVVVVGVLVGLVKGVLPALRPSSATATAMGGAYNIAVAEFESVDADGKAVDSVAAHDLAQSVYEFLRTELELVEEGEFELRAPLETGRIEGSTPEQRAEAAATQARRIRADVVVYGTLRVDVPNQFTAEFFLSDRLLEKAEELFGQHDLGSAITTPGDIGRNAVILKDLREVILGRTRALAEFIVGLSYFGADQPQAALDHFEAASRAEGWDDGDGKEVLYLFLGHAAGELGDIARAGAFYEQALGLNPEYARARLGRAEVLLQESRGACEAGNVNVEGLMTALDAYRSALSARVQPALSDIPIKVTFAEARVHLCLSQALVGPYWADSERGFLAVIEEFRNDNTRIREFAADSYSGLGFVHLPAEGDPDAPDRFRRAAADYQSAFETSLDVDRKAFYASMRGFIFGRLGDPAAADEAYGLAVSLARDPAARATYEQARQALVVRP